MNRQKLGQKPRTQKKVETFFEKIITTRNLKR